MTTRSRLSDPLKLAPEFGPVNGALFKATGNGSVPQTTVSLLQLRAGQLVGNTYLTSLHTGNLRRAGESDERIMGVATWQDAPCFSDAERGPSPWSRRCSRRIRTASASPTSCTRRPPGTTRRRSRPP